MKRTSLIIAAVAGLSVAGLPASHLHATERVFFAFDDHSIPWQHNLQVTLVPAKKYAGNPVLRRGPRARPITDMPSCTARSSNRVKNSGCGIWG